MPIHILRARVTAQQTEEMQQSLKTYIKLAVDIQREIVAGGGEMHADCEGELLADGSVQEDVWGADWDPVSQTVGFTSLINIRPSRGNRSLRIEDPEIRRRVESIVRRVFGATA